MVWVMVKKSLLIALGFLASWAMAQQPLVIATNPTDSTQRQVYLDLISNFEEQNPQWDVRILAFEHEAYKARFLNSLASEKPEADVYFWFAGERMRSLVRQGQIRSLAKLWQDYALTDKMTSGSVAAVSVDRQPYALPVNYYHWGFYYKISVFKRLGLTPPENWSELLDVIRTLRESSVTPIALGSEAPWTLAAFFDYLNLRLNGLEFHQKLLAGRVSFLDPGVARVFDYWGQLRTAGAFDSSHARHNWQGVLPYFYRNMAGMMLMGNFFITQIPDRIKSDIGFFPFPDIVPDMPRYEEAPTDVLLIPERASNPEGAEQFLAFMAGAEQQSLMNNRLGKSSPNLYANSRDENFLREGRALLSQASAVTQFFDRDADPRLVPVGMALFQSYMASPKRLSEHLVEAESRRRAIFATGYEPAPG